MVLAARNSAALARRRAQRQVLGHVAERPWSSKRAVSACSMCCAFFGSTRTGGGSAHVVRAVRTWEMVVWGVREVENIFYPSFPLEFSIIRNRRSAPRTTPAAGRQKNAHSLRNMPRHPRFRLAHAWGHCCCHAARARGCCKRREVPTNCASLRTTSRPWFVHARAPPFCGRGAQREPNQGAGARSARSRTPTALVPRGGTLKAARADGNIEKYVLVSLLAGRRSAKSSSSGSCPSHCSTSFS